MASRKMMEAVRPVSEATDKTLFAVDSRGQLVQRATKYDGNGRMTTEWRPVPQDISDEALANMVAYYARGEWDRPSLA